MQINGIRFKNRVYFSVNQQHRSRLGGKFYIPVAAKVFRRRDKRLVFGRNEKLRLVLHKIAVPSPVSKFFKTIWFWIKAVGDLSSQTFPVIVNLRRFPFFSTKLLTLRCFWKSLPARLSKRNQSQRSLSQPQSFQNRHRQEIGARPCGKTQALPRAGKDLKVLIC